MATPQQKSNKPILTAITLRYAIS